MNAENKKRLERLEAARPAAAADNITLDSILAKLEDYPGQLPRNEAEAAAVGYSSAAAACADSFGMTLAEFKEWLNREN